MGYCYDHAGRLACDNCGSTGTTRRRTCPYKVRDTSRQNPWSGPYCPAPAVCAPCYKTLGGLRGLHGDDCLTGAAASQARYDGIAARLVAGDSQVRTRWGSWAENVPKGHYAARYQDNAGNNTVYVVLDDGERYDWLSEVPASIINHEASLAFATAEGYAPSLTQAG